MKFIVKFSDIPAAIGPFFFTLIENSGSVGDRMWILCGIGDLLIILTVAAETLPS